jgi:hypothetical protein
MEYSLSTSAVRSFIETCKGSRLPLVSMPPNNGSGASGLDYNVAVLASVTSATVIELHKTGQYSQNLYVFLL